MVVAVNLLVTGVLELTFIALQFFAAFALEWVRVYVHTPAACH